MPRSIRGGVLAGVLLALGLNTTSHAATVVLEPDRDNSIYEFGPNQSNGIGPELFSGETNFNGSRRALLRFDIAGNVPAGATITSAVLTIKVLQSGVFAEDGDMHTLRRVTSDWGEAASGEGTGSNGAGSPAEPGDATWAFNFFGTSSWASLGGDYLVSPSATTPIVTFGVDTIGPTSTMVSDVTGWLNSPATNYGWILLSAESVPGSSRRLGSREALAVNDRPFLTVQFTAGGGGARGAVGDGDDVPGLPLTVQKAAGTNLRLRWDDSCQLSDTDYAVYEGRIGLWYSHLPVLCSTGASELAQVSPSFPGSYFLIVPHNTVEEGSYGDDWLNDERPVSSSACLPQNIGAPVCP